MTTKQQIPPPAAATQLATEGDLPVQAIHFQEVKSYTTFSAEYAVSEGDIIFHFYVTPEVQKLASPEQYWLQVFPSIISPVAEEYFSATFPRLKAAYTEEKASWWMRAFGFGMVLEPHKLAHGFFDKLDAALDEALKRGV